MLKQRHPGANQQGHQAGDTDQVEPPLRPCQRRIQTRQEKYPGFDHGRRMQIRRHRRRRGHGMGQPEMERELRRLGEYAQQHQNQRQRVQLMGADRITGRQHLG